MEINSFCLNQVRLNNNCVKNAQKLSCSECDSVSFLGKVTKKNKSGKIPFRLMSKYQDDFHSTSLQIYIRMYLDLKNKGLAEPEIIQAFANNKDCSLEELEQIAQTVRKISMNIEKLDDSFDEIIPSLKPNTYYRGIFDQGGNKAIDIVKNAKVGDVIVPDDGYSFLSTDYLEAETYAKSIDGFHSADSSVIMTVNIPKGVPISRDLLHKTDFYETNIVLPRGARYKVIENKVQHDKNYITLEYLDCATDRGE